jgi:hypothetical protein
LNGSAAEERDCGFLRGSLVDYALRSTRINAEPALCASIYPHGQVDELAYRTVAELLERPYGTMATRSDSGINAKVGSQHDYS